MAQIMADTHSLIYDVKPEPIKSGWQQPIIMRTGPKPTA